MRKNKRKGQGSTSRASQVNGKHCRGNVRHREEPAFSLGRSPCPHTRTNFEHAAMQPHAAPGCGIMVSAPVIQAIT